MARRSPGQTTAARSSRGSLRTRDGLVAVGSVPRPPAVVARPPAVVAHALAVVPPAFGEAPVVSSRYLNTSSPTNRARLEELLPLTDQLNAYRTKRVQGSERVPPHRVARWCGADRFASRRGA